MLGRMKNKLGSRLPGEISITSDTQMIPVFFFFLDDTRFMAESEEELKSLLMKVKETVKKLA